MFFSKRNQRSADGREFGLCNGLLPGQVGVWGQSPTSTELLRVMLAVGNKNSAGAQVFSYSFCPSLITPFCQSLQIPYQVTHLIGGRDRETDASFSIEFHFDGAESAKFSYDFKSFAKNLHGRGLSPPEGLSFGSPSVDCDGIETQSLSLSDLKHRSDELRKQLEAKRKKEEEERRAKEIAEAEAKAEAVKAAAQKAASDKPIAGKFSEVASPKAEGPTLPPCKVALFFGSSTGNTESVAEMVRKEMGDAIEQVKNVKDATAHDFAVPEILILGVPTWHIGEMQDDWALLLPKFEELNPNLAGKKVAIFGLGDGKGYPDTYVDAMQELWEKFEKRGAKLYGLWPTEGYKFEKSKAMKDGKFLGLVIDVENQDDLTTGRVKAWASQVRSELAI